MANSSWGKATSATQRAKDTKKQAKKKKEEQEQKLYYPQNVNRNYYDSDDLLDQMMQERSSRPRPTVTGGTKVSAEPGRREQKTSVTRSNVNTDVTAPSELRPVVDERETRNAAMDMLKANAALNTPTAAQNAAKYASGQQVSARALQQIRAMQNGDGTQFQSNTVNVPVQQRVSSKAMEQIRAMQSGDNTKLNSMTPDELVKMRSEGVFQSTKPSVLSAIKKA